MDVFSAEWAHVALTFMGMLLMGSAFVWAIRTDNKILATKLGSVEDRLNKIDITIDKLNDQQARLSVFDERLLAQGQRLDSLLVEFRDFNLRLIAVERRS